MLNIDILKDQYINYNNYLHQLFYMEGEKAAMPISTPPRAKWFTSFQDLTKAFEKFKAKQQNSILIPVVFHHTPMGKKDKDVAILMVHPQTTISNIVVIFQNMTSNRYKQHQKQRVFIYYRHKKYLLAATDKNTVEHEYMNNKDQDGFLHINYYFEGEYFYGPTGGQLALIVLAIPLIVAIEGTKAIYNWTTKAASNLKNPLSLFSSQQRYKFKDSYSLQQRRSKNKQFTEKNPRNVMIIVEKHEKSKLAELPFIKFLAQQSMIYGQLVSLLQNRIRTAELSNKTMEKQSVFFSINNKIPDRQATLIEIYQKYRHEDNIVYITYQQQETF